MKDRSVLEANHNVQSGGIVIVLMLHHAYEHYVDTRQLNTIAQQVGRCCYQGYNEVQIASTYLMN